MRTLLLLPLLALLQAHEPDRRAEPAAANDNRRSAGTLKNGVLSLELEARPVFWHPDRENDPAFQVFAFAETGKVAQIPGPLIRVRAGTTVRVTVRNPLPHTLTVTGLHSRSSSTPEAPLVIPAGEARAATFRLDEAGTYFYWGATTDTVAVARRHKRDTQLHGAILVDDADGRSRGDRVFIVSQYVEAIDANTGAPAEGVIPVSAINGKSWPNTERLTHRVGDRIRWRVINLSNSIHPMHLHGFYFSVERRGDMRRDTSYEAAMHQRVVTERMPPGTTMLMSWTPERAGNWLFHCHVPAHIAPRIAHAAHAAVKGSKPTANHALHGMAGLVLGIHVKGVDQTDAVAKRAPRKLRVVVERDAAEASGALAYRFTLDEPDALAASGIGVMLNPVLLVRKDEPVAINVVNTLDAPTAVHWHGIELESYFDGVAGFGGHEKRIAPVIEAGDSFNVRFTPPRAGTFIYHTHIDEPRQERAGLSGALIVLDTNAVFDPRTDHVILISSPRVRDPARVAINNSLTPRPLELRAGENNRLRFINMMLGPPRGVEIRLVRDTTSLRWQPLAKDGMDLPPNRSAIGPARVRISMGETYDFGVKLDAGDYSLEMRDPPTGNIMGRRAITVR